jgi:hypothetical protein
MLHTNHHHIQAPIEAPEPRDEAARERAVELLTEIVTDEFMQDLVRVDEARGFFLRSEDAAICAAIIAGDAMRVGQITIEACRRVVEIAAEAEAERRVDAMEREDEANYYAARVAS